MPHEIEGFLDEQRLGPVESEGTFTLDLARARQKLARHRHSMPHLYVLKLLQAAVVSGAELADFYVDRRVGQVEFRTRDASLARPADLLASLERPHSSGSGAMNHLVFALGACASGSYKRIEWFVTDGERGQTLVLTPGGTRLEEGDGADLIRGRTDTSPGELSCRFSLVRESTMLGISPVGLKASTAECDALVAHTQFCPIEIRLNDKRLDCRWPAAPQERWWSRHTAHFFFLQKCVGAQADGPSLRIPVPWERLGWDDELEAWRWNGARANDPTWFYELPHQAEARNMFGGRPSVNCTVALRASVDLSGPSRVIWVTDGISSEPHLLELGFTGTEVVVANDGIKTDLSGFSLVRGPAYQERVAGLKARVFELKGRVQQTFYLTEAVRFGRPTRGRRLVGVREGALNRLFDMKSDPYDHHLAKLVGDWRLVGQADEPQSYLAICEKGDTLGMGRVTLYPPERGDDQEFCRYFHRSMAEWSGLSHPSLLKLHDFGEQEGLLFRVVAPVPGQSLVSRLAERPSNQSQALRWSLELTAGLSHAHNAGLVYENFCPQSVWVSQDDSMLICPPTPKPSFDPRIARVGELESPCSMPPEAIQGQAWTTFSDQFALGTVLYEMATGRSAFGAQPGNPVGVILRILQEDPVDPRELVPDMPDGFATAILRCLARDPDKRFASLAELEQVLSAC